MYAHQSFLGWVGGWEKLLCCWSPTYLSGVSDVRQHPPGQVGEDGLHPGLEAPEGGPVALLGDGEGAAEEGLEAAAGLAGQVDGAHHPDRQV